MTTQGSLNINNKVSYKINNSDRRGLLKVEEYVANIANVTVITPEVKKKLIERLQTMAFKA